MDILVQPDIEIWSIRLQEPVTTLTDALVGVVCLYAFWKLNKTKVKGKPIQYLKLYFIIMGVAMVLGGVLGHGFQYALGMYWKLPGWYLSMFAIMLIERSAIEHAGRWLNPTLHKALLWLNLVELAVIMVLSGYYLNFKFVEFHSVYGLLGIVFTFHLLAYRKSKEEGSKYVLYAIGVLFVAMMIFNFHVTIDKWFNHHDLAHVLMAISSLLLMKGGLHMAKATDRT